MIVHGVFTRHPKLKAVSIENGSYFVHRLIKRLKKAANNHPRLFPEDPVEQLRNNVWIAPYYEDDLPSWRRVDRCRQDSVRIGLAAWRRPWRIRCRSPRSWSGFSDADIRKIMRDNALDLLDVKVVVGRLNVRSRVKAHERVDHRGGPGRDRRGRSRTGR